uniref:Uncharacterized protein n=1 Tax=Amphimedon queenslandica TaxID=400682 RepID=A0A1X7TXY4_AMPQE
MFSIVVYSKILKVNGIGNTSNFSTINWSTSSCPHCLCGMSHCSNRYIFKMNTKTTKPCLKDV